METGYLTEMDGKDTWRISVPVSSLSNISFADLLTSARTCAEEAVDSADAADGIHIRCTGAIALYDEIQQQMLKDLTNTYAAAFLAITATICLALGSVRAGLISMIPNLFPAVVVLGAIGWLDVKMDVASIMTASVALGIAVDGTLHYVIAFRRSVGAGASQAQGIHDGYSRCGVALIQATIICAFGIHFLGYSQFLPTARFGWSIAAMLAFALLGDLLLLPALLVGPLGRFFIRSRTIGAHLDTFADEIEFVVASQSVVDLVTHKHVKIGDIVQIYEEVAVTIARHIVPHYDRLIGVESVGTEHDRVVVEVVYATKELLFLICGIHELQSPIGRGRDKKPIVDLSCGVGCHGDLGITILYCPTNDASDASAKTEIQAPIDQKTRNSLP